MTRIVAPCACLLFYGVVCVSAIDVQRGITDIGRKASTLLDGMAWKQSTRHFPQVKYSEWDINGKAEQQYIAGVFRDSGGVGIVLGVCFSFAMCIGSCMLRRFFKGGCCTTGSLARPSCMHRYGTFLLMSGIIIVLGFCGFKVYLGSGQLAVGINRIFNETQRSAEDAASFFCGGQHSEDDMKYALPSGQRRRRLADAVEGGRALAALGGLGGAGGASMSPEQIREMQSNARRCGNTSIVAFLSNTTGTVVGELDEVSTFVSSMDGAVPPLKRIVGTLHNLTGHMGHIGETFADIKNDATRITADIAALQNELASRTGSTGGAGAGNANGMLPDMSSMDEGVFREQRASIAGMANSTDEMVATVERALEQSAAPIREQLGKMKGTLGGMGAQFTATLLGMQSMALSSGRSVGQVQQQYQASLMSLQTQLLGGLALVPFFINAFGMIGYVIGCCSKRCRCTAFSRCSAALVFLFLFWFALVGGIFRALNALTIDLCAERYGLIKFYTQDMNVPLRTQTLNLSDHITDALQCNDSVPGKNNLVDIFNLKQELNVSSLVRGATEKVAGAKAMLNQTSKLDGALTMLNSAALPASKDVAVFNQSAIMAQVSMLTGVFPSVDPVTGKLNMSDNATQAKIRALPGIGSAVDFSLLNGMLNTINDQLRQAGIDFVPYTLNNVERLNSTAMAVPPLSDFAAHVQHTIDETVNKTMLVRLNQQFSDANVSFRYNTTNYRTLLVPGATQSFPFRGDGSLEQNTLRQLMARLLPVFNAAFITASRLPRQLLQLRGVTPPPPFSRNLTIQDYRARMQYLSNAAAILAAGPFATYRAAIEITGQWPVVSAGVQAAVNASQTMNTTLASSVEPLIGNLTTQLATDPLAPMRNLTVRMEQVGTLVANLTALSAISHNTSRAINASVMNISVSLGRLKRIETDIHAAKHTMEVELNASTDKMRQASRDLDARVASFESIPPKMMATAGDYAHCGWVGDAFRGIVEVGVCQETQRGLDEISKWLIGGVCVFFVSFFVQIHAVAVIQASSDFDKEFGHMELSTLDSDDEEDYDAQSDPYGGKVVRYHDDEGGGRQRWDGDV